MSQQVEIICWLFLCPEIESGDRNEAEVLELDKK